MRWLSSQALGHLPGIRYLLFCAGGWRSALVALTMQQMGVGTWSIDGGFALTR